jgi:hypothetical protein
LIEIKPAQARRFGCFVLFKLFMLFNSPALVFSGGEKAL